jgi:hypothetical protein
LAGAGCCFTQPRTLRFHHVPCWAVGHWIIIGAKAPYLKSNNQNPSSNLCPQTSHYTSGWMVATNIRGLPHPSVTMAATLLVLQGPLPSSICMCSPHLLHTSSHVFLPPQSTPLYLSLPYNGGVARIGSHHSKAKQALCRHGPQNERPR